MLSFDIVIHNPWAGDTFKSLWESHGDFPERFEALKTKGWELQLSYSSLNLFGVHVDLSWRGRNHAGPHIEITMLGFIFEAQICDCRHWDYQNGTWEEIDENPSEYSHQFQGDK